MIADVIKDYWATSDKWFSSYDIIRNVIWYNKGIHYKQSCKIDLKTCLNRSFRKASSRLHKMDTKLNKVLVESFVFEVENLINGQKYIIIFDETNFSNKTAFNYLWLAKKDKAGS